jgi:hypothetical protein
MTDLSDDRFFSRHNWDDWPYNVNPVYDNRERSTWWMQPSSDNNLFGSKNLNVRGCDSGSTGEVRLYTDGDQAKKNSSCSYNAGPSDSNWDAPHWLRWKRILARQLLYEQFGTCWYDFDDILNLDGKYFWLLDENHDEYHVWFRWYQNDTSDPDPSGSNGGYEVILYPDATIFRQHHPEQERPDTFGLSWLNLYKHVAWGSADAGERLLGLPSGQYADNPADAPYSARRFSKQPYYWDWWNLGIPPYRLLRDLNSQQPSWRFRRDSFRWPDWPPGRIGIFNKNLSVDDPVEGNNWEIVMPTLLLSACIKYFLHDSIDNKDRKWTIDIDGRVLNHKNRFPLEFARDHMGRTISQDTQRSLYQETQWSFLDISTIKKETGEGLMCYMSDGDSGLAFENNRDNDFYIGGGNCCGGYPQYGHNARLFVTIPCCHCDTEGTWRMYYDTHYGYDDRGNIINTWTREKGGHFENLTYNIAKPQCGPNDPPCLCHNASLRGRLGDGTTPDGVGKQLYTGTYGDVWYDLHEYRTDKFNCYKCNEFTLEKSTGHRQCDRSHNITLPDKLHICPKETCRDNLIVVVINDVDTVYGHEDRALAGKVWDFDKQLFDSIDYDFNVIYIQPRPHGNYTTLPWYSNNVDLISAGSWPNRVHYKPVDNCNELSWCKKPSDLGTDYPYQHNWGAGCLRVTWDEIITSINAVSNGRAPDHVHFIIDGTVWGNIALKPPGYVTPTGWVGAGRTTSGSHSNVRNLVYSKRICFDPSPAGGGGDCNWGVAPVCDFVDGQWVCSRLGTGIWNHENCYKYEGCQNSMDLNDVGWDTTIWAGFKTMLEVGTGVRTGMYVQQAARAEITDPLPNREGKFCNEGFSVSIQHTIPAVGGGGYWGSGGNVGTNRWMGMLVDYLVSRQLGGRNLMNGVYGNPWGSSTDWENNWHHRTGPVGTMWPYTTMSEGDHFGASGDSRDDGHGGYTPYYTDTTPGRTGHIRASDMVTPEGCGWWGCLGLPVGLCPKTEPNISRVGFSCYDLKRADMETVDYPGHSERGQRGGGYFPVIADPENNPDIGCWQWRDIRPWKHASGGTGALEHRLVGGQITAGHWGPWYGIAMSSRHHKHGCMVDLGESVFYGSPREADAYLGSGWCMPENLSESIECWSRRKINSLAAVKDSMFRDHTYWSHNWNGSGNQCPCSHGDIPPNELAPGRNPSDWGGVGPCWGVNSLTCIGQDNLSTPPHGPRHSHSTILWWKSQLGGHFFGFGGRHPSRWYIPAVPDTDQMQPFCARQKTMYEHNSMYKNEAFWRLIDDDYKGRDELTGNREGFRNYWGHKRICEQCVCPEAQDRQWQIDVPDTGAKCSWGNNDFALGGTYILDYYWQDTNGYNGGGIATTFGWHWGGPGRGTGYGDIAGIDEEDRAFTITSTTRSGKDYGVSVPMWNIGFTYSRPWDPNSNYGFRTIATGCKWVLHGTNTWWDRIEFTMADGGGPGYWNMHPDWSLPFLNAQANQNWFGVLTFFNGKHEPIISYGFTGHKNIDIVYPITVWDFRYPRHGLSYKGCDLRTIGTITSQFRIMHRTFDYRKRESSFGGGGTGAECGPSCRRTTVPPDAGTKNRQDKDLMPEADPLNPNAVPYPYTYRFENCNMWDWMPDTITMTLL